VLLPARAAVRVRPVPTLTHLNPDGLPTNPAFSQAVAVEGALRTVYVGGQNGVGADGAVAPGIREQTAQALRNLETVLKAAGTTLDCVVRWNVLVVSGASLGEAVDAFAEVWGDRGDPPAITVAIVEALARRGLEVEIDAIAVAGGEG
jgi:enamine deaminase RidA (YjgF/YER057c/UK114 family)